jgi:hypothetical protein
VKLQPHNDSGTAPADPPQPQTPSLSSNASSVVKVKGIGVSARTDFFTGNEHESEQ